MESVELLNKGSYLPLYVQIQNKLLEHVESGHLSEGDPFPSEEELSRQFRVSRMTARQALQSLKQRGYAVSQRGRGTFVSKPKYEKNILHLQSFTDEMVQNSVKPSSVVLEQTCIEAGEEIGELLKIPADEKILCLRRLRLADDAPIAIEVSHLSLVRFPGLDRFDFNQSSLYRVLHDNYNLQVAWADEVFEAVQATQTDATLLEMSESSSLLSIKRVMMLSDDEPVEYACSLYRGDRYQAKLRLPVAHFL